MPSLPYLSGYPAHLIAQIETLIAEDRLGQYLHNRYPERHDCTSDRALYDKVTALRQKHLRNAPPIDRVLYDSKLDVLRNALGLHTRQAKNHGGRLRSSREIRVSGVFRDCAPEFLDMIVVHELAHLREMEHNKAFYQLCEHMLPGYAQLEFDVRLYLTWKELPER